MHKIQLPNSPTTVNAELLGSLLQEPISDQTRLTGGYDDGIGMFRLPDGGVAITTDLRNEPYVNGAPRPTVLAGSAQEVGAVLQDDDRAQALLHLFDVQLPGRFDTQGYPRLTATAVRMYTYAAHHQGLQGRLTSVGLQLAGDQRPVETWRLAFGPLDPSAFTSVMELRQFISHLRWDGHSGISAAAEQLLVVRWQVWHEDVASGQLMHELFGVAL